MSGSFLILTTALLNAGGLVALVLVVAGIILMISLFERRRARHIEQDLHDMALAQHIQPVVVHRLAPHRRRHEHRWW